MKIARTLLLLTTSATLVSCSSLQETDAPEAMGLATPMFSPAGVGGAKVFGSRTAMLSRFRSDTHNTETYDSQSENAFKSAEREPLSTFSIDVDTASYANFRRFVREGDKPPTGAVRVEEFINYFDYDYPAPAGGKPFAVHTEVAACPWNAEHRIALVALRARDIPTTERPPANLVFLIDVSGSMGSDDKLPLVKKAMRLLVGQLHGRDRISIVTYAGDDAVLLSPTCASHKDKIIAAIDDLGSGGSTHGSAGIITAYQLAKKNFKPGQINRVILATDGDFNVGVTNESDLVSLIQKQAKTGVFLTALGFGTGNLKDATLQKLAQNGNGQHAYIDSEIEAKKVLVTELGSTLQVVAKDVKIQVEFNPATVKSYRLVGYESRLLDAEDFDDDQKDAGELGAGHRVTALYELVPPGAPDPARPAPALKYQTDRRKTGTFTDLFTPKIRHKKPSSSRSQLTSLPVVDSNQNFEQASTNFRFAAAVAAFGMLLTDSDHKGTTTRSRALSWAKAAAQPDPDNLRAEFLTLARKAKLP